MASSLVDMNPDNPPTRKVLMNFEYEMAQAQKLLAGILVFGAVIAFIALVMVKMNNDDAPKPKQQPYACTKDNGVYVKQGELPHEAIKRASDALLPKGAMDIDNFGDAAQVLVDQYADGIVPPAAYVSVCVTLTKVLSVNGDAVE